jgi:hypothetical protein
MTLTWYRHFQRSGGLNQILRRQTSRFHYDSKVPAVTITAFITILEKIGKIVVIAVLNPLEINRPPADVSVQISVSNKSKNPKQHSDNHLMSHIYE